MTGTPNQSPDFAAEVLSEQYKSVFAVPRPAWLVQNVKEHFSEVDDPDILADIKFGQKDIEQACEELKSTSAPGPDGVPAQLLKYCRKS